jgi:YVTN family beta-propeller protein
MRALYLTGRQADALEFYRHTRTLLQNQLGVEPGPELQRLERQILNQDPDLGEPTAQPRPAVRRRRFQFAAALACVLVATVVYAALAFPRGGAQSSTRPNVSNPTSAVSAIDPRTNRVVSTTAVGRYPSRIAADRNAVWVINAQDETISRIDPRTRSVVHTFAPGSTPTDLVPFANAVWVATPLTNRVLRLDESTDEVTAQISAPNPLFLDSARGKLWVVGKTIQTLDPATRKRTLVFDASLPDSPAADANFGSIVVLGRRLFISSAGMAVTHIAGRGFDPGMAVTRIDTSTSAVRQSKKFAGQGADSARIIAAKGSLWLTCPTLGRLLQVNPGSLVVIRKIAVGEQPVGVSFGAGSLWVANSNDGTVMRIDPANGRVLATIRVGGTPFDMTFAHHLAWVTIL